VGGNVHSPILEKARMSKIVKNVILMNVDTDRAKLVVSMASYTIPAPSKNEAVDRLCEMIREEPDTQFNITDVSKDESGPKAAPALYTGPEFLEKFTHTPSL
jgi:hypothetical protein